MAKSKRVRRVKSPQKVQQERIQEAAVLTPPKQKKSGTAAASSISSSKDLSEEYAYVIKDLRRVFLIAAAMFAILIILNLILQ